MMLNQGQIKEATEVLRRLEARYPDDEGLVRILGKALYWSKDFDEVKRFFREKLSKNQQLHDAQLDYGRILYELQSWEECEEVLTDLLKKEPLNVEANQKMAEITYWQGGSKKKSLQYIDWVLQQYPKDERALAIQETILTETATHLSFSAGYFSDSQPLNYLQALVEVSGYFSSKLQPGFRIDSRFYQDYSQVNVVSFSNKFSFFSSKTSITGSVGVAINKDWEEPLIPFSLKVDQNLGKGFLVSGDFGKEAYLYTTQSVLTPISPRFLRFNLEKSGENTWIGKLFLDQNQFEDENRVRTIGLWFLYPILSGNDFELSLGYSGVLVDSDSLKFIPKEGVPASPGNSQGLIPGEYNPYFTPTNQVIHGLLGKFSYQFFENQQIQVSANIGVWAEIDNPNLYLTGPGQGPPPFQNEDNYALFLFRERYFPMDLSLDYKLDLKDSFTLGFNYHYQKTIFFDSQYMGLKLFKTF